MFLLVVWLYCKISARQFPHFVRGSVTGIRANLSYGMNKVSSSTLARIGLNELNIGLRTLRLLGLLLLRNLL
jgi:hypothetical protein